MENNMKLELKHLAPYLPYGLRIEILNYKSDYVWLRYSSVNGFYFIGEHLHLTYTGGATGKDVSTFRPILRPMSDLEDKIYLQQLYELGHSIEYSNGTFFDEAGTYNDTRWLPQICFDVLLTNHFDVFGLIPSGLAIDINTLSNG